MWRFLRRAERVPRLPAGPRRALSAGAARTRAGALHGLVRAGYIRRMITNRGIDAFKLGRNWVIERESWERYLKSQRGRGRPRR
jgi:hypothetical protein